MTIQFAGHEMPCVPASLGVARGRVCLASIDDHRVGRLTGQWVALDVSKAELEAVARSILQRATAAVHGVGVFDVEGASLDDPKIRRLLEPVLGVAGSRLLDS